MTNKIIRILLLGIMLLWFPAIAQSATQDESPILATRGKAIVTQDRFDARMSKVKQEDLKPFLMNSERFKTALTTLLLRAQLVADAEESGFQHQKDVAARLELARVDLLANIWLEHYVDENSNADFETLAREYYVLNKKDIKTADTVDVTQLLINAQQGDISKQRAIAEDLLKQVQENPDGFDELVLSRSEDPGIESNKGRITGLKRGDTVEAFENAAFALKTPGDFSGLVHSEYGFHIIRLDAFHSGRQLSFDETRNSIIAREKIRIRDNVRAQYLSQLSSLEVEIPENAVTDMLVRYFGEEIREQIENANTAPESE
jgi:parvulin-like peptidyl-prolyl isomerase